MIPMRLWHPLTALLGGLITVVLVQWIFPAAQVAALANDLAAATGIPVNTSNDIPTPWGTCMLGLGAACVVWVCIEVGSFLVQCGLLVATIALLLTGAWLAHLGGGGFPTVPVIIALLVAFILGQFAAGLGGNRTSQAIQLILAGSLRPDRIQAVLANPPPASVDLVRVHALIELPATDQEFLPTLIRGLMLDGAWVREADDGRLHIVFGLFDTDAEAAVQTNDIWAALARVADAMAARPHPWRMASATGVSTRVVNLGDRPGLYLRGPTIHMLARWLEEFPPAADDTSTQWLCDLPVDVPVPGWATNDATVPARLKPVATPCVV